MKTSILDKKHFARIATPMARGLMVAASALALCLSATQSEAGDVGAGGGGGGGAFRISCEAGDQLVGLDVIATHVLIAVAPVCGNRKLSPTDTYGRAWVGGEAEGGSYKPRCELDAVITILHVFWDKTPLVNRVGFTCWHTRNMRMTNSPASYGGEAVGNTRLICPQGQIATGIYGRAGGAIDQLGLICGPW